MKSACKNPLCISHQLLEVFQIISIALLAKAFFEVCVKLRMATPTQTHTILWIKPHRWKIACVIDMVGFSFLQAFAYHASLVPSYDSYSPKAIFSAVTPTFGL